MPTRIRRNTSARTHTFAHTSIGPTWAVTFNDHEPVRRNWLSSQIKGTWGYLKISSQVECVYAVQVCMQCVCVCVNCKNRQKDLTALLIRSFGIHGCDQIVHYPSVNINRCTRFDIWSKVTSRLSSLCHNTRCRLQHHRRGPTGIAAADCWALCGYICVPRK